MRDEIDGPGRKVSVDRRQFQPTFPRPLADANGLDACVRGHLNAAGDPSCAGGEHLIGDGVGEKPPLDGRAPSGPCGGTHPRKCVQVNAGEHFGHDPQRLIARSDGKQNVTTRLSRFGAQPGNRQLDTDPIASAPQQGRDQGDRVDPIGRNGASLRGEQPEREA